MSRRNVSWVCCLVVVGANLVVFLSAASATPPNVLVIVADDLGYADLGVQGSKHVKTPNIDSIASGGVRLTKDTCRRRCARRPCAGLMTGRYQTRFGHENNVMARRRSLPLTETTLANRMKTLGYATCAVGKWHLGSAPDRLPTARGFDEFYGVLGNPGSYFKPHGFIDSRKSTEPEPITDPNFYTTDAFAADAAALIEGHKDAPGLYLPFNAVHGPARSL